MYVKNRFAARVANMTAMFLVVLFSGVSCNQEASRVKKEGLAADTDVANFMERFEGRGQLVDDSQLPKPEQTLKDFRLAPGLVADLVLSEPRINQPVEIAFDHRGRLWVVQYSQYPYPAGLKITDIDHHVRVTYDKVPEPPPAGVQGADKITFFEDTDGDGLFDKSSDAITGLNVVTAVTWGRQQIWVLNPPYLLAYPDRNDDGLPDGPPKVCISGFGLEDTHAVANSLCWGPDGWLYGATGSTTHQYISTTATDMVHYKGQGIWRYHPGTEVFEIFSEGGGNTFHVEIDAKGRIYSGTNGTSKGQYYKQGAYYKKNWGKHGVLTNDYAYGFLPDMEFTGEPLRFTHAWVKYQSATLPQYRDHLLSINPLHHFVQASTFSKNGSSFATTDADKILESSDRWFRPVDIKVGPDGAIYLADWSDSRLSHINPRDDWHKTSGRVYRIRGEKPVHRTFDLSRLSDDELIDQLASEEKWFRQQALRLMADRKNKDVVPRLMSLMKNADAQLALEALWAAVLSGGVTSQIVQLGLQHEDPHLRMWTIRLTTDAHAWSADLQKLLLTISAKEAHPEVLSQLACSAKRMDSDLGLQVLEVMMPLVSNDDPDNPLLVWWALEQHMDERLDKVRDWMKRKEFWRIPVVNQWLLPRMMQRSMERRSNRDLRFALEMFDSAPDRAAGTRLLQGFLQGTSAADLANLPPDLVGAAQRFESTAALSTLATQVRQGQEEAVVKAMSMLSTEGTILQEKLALVGALGGSSVDGVVESLLALVKDRDAPKPLIAASLQSLSHYQDLTVGEEILDAFPDHLRAHALTKSKALFVVAQRRSWSESLMDRILQSRQIDKEELSRSEVLQLRWSLGEDWHERIDALWPEHVLPNKELRAQEMDRVEALLSSEGNRSRGKPLFSIFCGTCHRLHNEGNDIGPDLTGYDRGNTAYLISHTLDPDLDLREGYVQYALKTTDGRSFIGVITERTNQAVTLRPYMSEALSFRMDGVSTLEPIKQSMMPGGLLSDLPDDQIRDLFSYLQGPALE